MKRPNISEKDRLTNCLTRRLTNVIQKWDFFYTIKAWESKNELWLETSQGGGDIYNSRVSIEGDGDEIAQWTIPENII